MPSVLLFDLDNTLIDRDSALRRFFTRNLDKIEQVHTLMALDGSGYGNRQKVLAYWSSLRKSTATQEDLIQGIVKNLELPEGFLNTLSILAKECTLGILSNGRTQSQTRKVEATNLHHVIPSSRIWISEAMGLRKPDPVLFESICTQLKVPPQDCIYLGDRDEIDRPGAETVGMPFQLVERPLNTEDLLRLMELVT